MREYQLNKHFSDNHPNLGIEYKNYLHLYAFHLIFGEKIFDEPTNKD
jgi:hypothetical protein